MKQPETVEERLRDTAWPEPGADLRDRVLAAAGARVRASVTWADVMWFSRRWRLAAVALFLALGLLDRVSVLPVSPVRDPGTVAVQTARAAEETALQAGMPPDEAKALARQALIAASQPGPGEMTFDLKPWTLGLGPAAEGPKPKAEGRQ